MNSVLTPEQALSHLYFHFCNKDGEFDKNEIDFIAAKFVALNMNRQLDFKQEVLHYKNNRNQFSSENDFINSLISTIKPVHTLALFADCVDICVSDQLISIDEQALLNDLATILSINEIQKDTIIALLVERKAAELI